MRRLLVLTLLLGCSPTGGQGEPEKTRAQATRTDPEPAEQVPTPKAAAGAGETGAADGAAGGDEPASDETGSGADSLVPLPNTPRVDVDFSAVHPVDVEEGHFTITTLNFKASKGFEQLAEQFEGYADGIETKLPEQHRDLPKAFKVGQVVSLVTQAGVLESKVEGLGLAAGGSELQLRVVLGPGPEGAHGFALSKGKFHPGAVVREIKPAPISRALLIELAKRVPELASPEAKELLRRYHVDKGENLSFKPRLPPDVERVVTVAIPVGPDEPHEPFISGMFAVGRDGSLHVLEPVENRMESFGIAYVADLDGDGIDEMLSTSEYYEGAYEHLLRWNGKTWKSSMLAGDGA